MGLSDPADLSASVGESSQRYAARMVYLSEEDEGALFGSSVLEPMGRTLKPPVLFMSRRQARADSALCAVRGGITASASALRTVLSAVHYKYVSTQPGAVSVYTLYDLLWWSLETNSDTMLSYTL